MFPLVEKNQLFFSPLCSGLLPKVLDSYIVDIKGISIPASDHLELVAEFQLDK